MNPLCETIQRKCLEPTGAGLTDVERRHAACCPECREALENAQVAAPVLREWAETACASGPALPESLRRRVRARLAGAMEVSAAVASQRVAVSGSRAVEYAARPSGSGGAARARAATRPTVWERLSDWWRAGGRRWVLAGAACLALIVTAPLALTSIRPVARLDFANGLVTLRNQGRVQGLVGVGEWRCGEGARVETEADAAAVLTVGNGEVRCALRGASRMEISGRRMVALDQGAGWFSVEPGGKGFAVRTPYGTARVTGTVFGVEVDESGMRVHVVEGTVKVADAGASRAVPAGFAISSRRSGLSELSDAGSQLPVWVTSLLSVERSARAGQYVPSLMREP